MGKCKKNYFFNISLAHPTFTPSQFDEVDTIFTMKNLHHKMNQILLILPKAVMIITHWFKFALVMCTLKMFVPIQ